MIGYDFIQMKFNEYENLTGYKYPKGMPIAVSDKLNSEYPEIKDKHVDKSIDAIIKADLRLNYSTVINHLPLIASRCSWETNGKRCNYNAISFKTHAKEGLCGFHSCMQSAQLSIVCFENNFEGLIKYIEHREKYENFKGSIWDNKPHTVWENLCGE
jgi:hypothetical protein|tara:strand:+ start:377 stop:847 length:471 start_codon:yes stop_codon:yes gene_type:complete